MTNFSPYIQNGSLVGMPLDAFDFSQAVAPGMSESTYTAQLTKAIAYWTNLKNTSTRPDQVSLANTAIGWLQTEQGLVQTPAINTLRIVYPV